MRLVKLVLFSTLLVAVPAAAQNIGPGDDIWNTSGGGATYTTINSSEWLILCGVNAPSQTIHMTGKNIPGLGTGDTVITRLGTADFSGGSTASVPIQLKRINFVSQGATPCSPNTVRMRERVPQAQQPISVMTVNREDALGGTFSAEIVVDAVYEVVNSSGQVIGGSVPVFATLTETSGPSPWSYQAPTGALHAGSPWHPGVSKTTLQPVQIRRSCIDIILNEHAYKPATKCPKVRPIEIEPVDPEPIDQEADASALTVIDVQSIEACSVSTAALR